MAAYAFDSLAGSSGATLVSPGVVSFAPGANRFAYLRAGAPARPRGAYSSTITVALSGTYVGFMSAGTSAPNNWVLDDDASSMGAGFDGQPYVFPPAGIPQTITWVHARGTIFALIYAQVGGGTVTIGPATELPAIIEGQPGTIPLPPTPPTITKLIPTAGPDTGGTLVDIVGANLGGATGVDFGGTAGTGLTVDPFGGLATVTSPAHTAGPAPVTITTPAGVSNAVTFTFEAPPVVTVPVIYAAYPLYLFADAADNQQVLLPAIYPITDVVSAEVGGVDVGVSGVLGINEDGFVVMGAPVLPPGTYDLILTNSAGSSDPYPIEYVDCSGGCPPDPTVVAVFPGAALPGATIQIVGTNLADATVTMCGEPVSILSNDGTIITVVVPPGCPDGDTTITVTTPDGETTADFAVLPVPEPAVPVIYAAYPLYLCADAADNQQVLLPAIYPITDVVSAEVGGVDVGVSGVLGINEDGFVVMGAPVLPPGTYDLILTNSAGSSDPYPIEYVDCEGCPPDPTVVAVFPGAARPGATIQIVGTNLTGATVTMCGDPVAIVSNDGTIITVVVPPGCPDGPTTITVTTPDGETTVEFTVLPPEPVPPADVSPRSWQIAQALLDAAFLCGAECARAFVTTDATPEGPPPGGCPCQLTATIVKDGYKTADGRRLVRSATIKLSLHQCTPIPQADEIPDPDTESDYALRQAETRDQMLRGLATARRQPSSVLGRCQTKQASEGWVHVSTTGGMSLYTMEVTVD